MDKVRFLPAGDCACTVEFGNEISESVNARVRALDLAIERAAIPGIRETVPTYRSLMVHYEPEEIDGALLLRKLEELTENLSSGEEEEKSVLEIPVLYGGEMGPDLAFVAEHAGISVEEVIRRHSGADYRIYMLGFTPGFPYLGGMDPSIAAPRLSSPRVRIPGGSVGIAGTQTGIYPIDSPGGWQIIGRTPLKLYDPLRKEPILPQAGQYIRFCPIDREEYDRLLGQRESDSGKETE